MSYLVLARKWRPQRFSEVVGQDHVTITLRKAVEKNRLAHAYLFAGPRGCGKTTTARILAKVINCENPSNSEPCNKCASCVAINEGKHMDVIEIDGASNRGIDEIRDLRERIGYAPSLGKSKIYIIDEVHMLTPQAFNALLKTLEEPPPHVYLIFATTEPQKVPATILSRCQRFNFKRLEQSEIVGQLKKICNSEGIEFEEDALVLISRSAGGSMRDAESLLDQCISASESKIDLALVRGVLGLVDSGIIEELLLAICNRDRKHTLSIVDRVVSSGLDVEEFFLAYVEGLRSLLVIKIDKDNARELLSLTSEEIVELSKLSSDFSIEDLLYLMRHAIRAYRDLKVSSQPRYLLEAFFTEAASWQSAVEVSELLERLGGEVADGASSGPASGYSRNIKSDTDILPGNNPSSIKGSEMVEVDTSRDEIHGEINESLSVKSEGTKISDSSSTVVSDDAGSILEPLGGKERWEKFLAKIREAKLTLGIWLMSANVVAVKGEQIVLDFAPQHKFDREMVFEDKNRRYIEKQMEKFFGRKFVLVSHNSGNPAVVSNEVKEKRSRKLDERLSKILKDEPVVKKLIEEFDGELLKDDEKNR